MAKGIAVSQIILLVLGILVLAVVAYLLYTNFVQTGTTISAETCRAEATRICTGCNIGQLSSSACPFSSQSMYDCVGTHVQGTKDTNPPSGTINCDLITGEFSGSGGGGGSQQRGSATNCQPKVGACPSSHPTEVQASSGAVHCCNI